MKLLSLFHKLLPAYLLMLLSASASSTSFTTASHQPHPSASSWFNVGAGQSYDGILYDNKQVQTFTPSNSGFIESVSIAVYRMTDTDAPLRIRITDTVSGTPSSTLAEAYIDSATIPTSLSGEPYLNAICNFSSTTLLLETGHVYGLVFDSNEPEANYRIYGSDQYDYNDGERFKSQNSSVWTQIAYDDLFFEIEARPLSEVCSLQFVGQNVASLEWTNSIGTMWIDISTNLADWKVVAGPLTSTSSWIGAISEDNFGFIRIRHKQ